MVLMSNGRLYRCPHVGCSQTSRRRWNMRIHIKRKHSERHSELAADIRRRSIPHGEQQHPFFPNHRETLETSNHHIYEPPYHLNASSDEAKNTKTILDKSLENLRTIIEARRLIDELTRNPVSDSISNYIAKVLIGQMASNSFQGKRSLPTKKETLPTGYRISYCDTCLSGCNLMQVFYPIEFEGITKLDHKCDPKNPFVGQNEEKILKLKRQVKILLRDKLSKIVSSRIGQRDAYLKAVKLSQYAFSEEKRTQLKVPANRYLIEERDCVKINPSCNKEAMDHWFCRVIRECDKNENVKITQNELAEFLRLARSTFGVFQVGTKKYYWLIYLVL